MQRNKIKHVLPSVYPHIATLGDDNSFSGESTFTNTLTLDGAALIASHETVDAGNGGAGATALSTSTYVSFVSTDTSKSHVSLADGVTGQIKVIVHKARANTVDLVITPANFAAGSTLTSDSPARSVTLMFDGTDWQVIAGEITGGAEMVIG